MTAPGRTRGGGVAACGSLVLTYRAFLLEPGTLVTLTSGLLLVLAAINAPGVLIGDREPVGAEGIPYLAAALVGSAYIWYSALRGIARRDFTSEIPVSLATGAAIAIGQYPAAAVVAVLLLTGGLLEEFVAAKAERAMVGLAALLPETAVVRRAGGDVVVPLEEIAVGEVVLVRSGNRIPVDGEVASGGASVNQAAITGESVPVPKTCGDTVYAGTFNEQGAIEVLTRTVGEQTLLGRIRALIVEARENKPPIERVLDRYARLYTPAALLLGGLLWWWSGEIVRAITMLIVFCPCVMVLATPTALVASIGNAAIRGNLVKGGAAIEQMAAVDLLVFDKTGTLTLGTPVLESVRAFDGLDEDLLLRARGLGREVQRASPGQGGDRRGPGSALSRSPIRRRSRSPPGGASPVSSTNGRSSSATAGS